MSLTLETTTTAAKKDAEFDKYFNNQCVLLED